MTRHLVITLDVTGLTEAQVDALSGELQAQAEASGPDEEFGFAGHPDVPVVEAVVVDA
jgi:hypothetical protein